MSGAFLYCRGCNEQFPSASHGNACPHCGQPLASWVDAPTQAFRGADTESTAAAGAPFGQGDPLVGSQLDNYWIEEFLGQGGMARVYRAKHLTLHRPCAIKVLKRGLVEQDAGAVESFLAEARAAAALVHPHVVTIHTIGNDRDLHFIEMEYIEGQSLARLAETSAPLDATAATRFMVDISSALAAAHQAGMVHRDIKPSNVMVTSSGTAKLADFGLAKRLLPEAGTESRALAGTPHYMAPELFQGQPASKRSDVYAMGVTHFVLLTGRLPVVGRSVAELAKIHAASVPPDVRELRPDASDEAATVLARCLAKNPDQRYHDGVQLHEELRALHGSLRSLESLLKESLRDCDVSTEGAGDRFVVVVRLPGKRSQTVTVEACRSEAVAEQVIRIFSVCGPTSEQHYRRALELNAVIPHGSIAIDNTGGKSHFVMTNAYPRATCDPEEIRQSVLTIGQYADEMEQLLTGRDKH